MLRNCDYKFPLIIGAVTLMMKAVSTSETSFNFYETTWHSIPQESHLYYNRYI